MTDAGASDADARGDTGATDADAIEDLTDLYREYGNERLPPGQRETDRFPVLSKSGTPSWDPETFEFEVWGAIEEPLSYSLSAFRDLPSVTQRQDFHCVTGWSKFDCAFTGVEFEEIVDRAGVHDDAEHVLFHALDGCDEPLAGGVRPQGACCSRTDSTATTSQRADHGGPIRVVTPHKYAYKGPNGSRASSSSRRRNSATGRSAATATPRTRGTRSATANPPSAHPTAPYRSPR